MDTRVEQINVHQMDKILKLKKRLQHYFSGLE